MQESETTTVKARDYLPLLGLVAAAVFGISLMCSAAVVGINDINNAVSVGTPTEGIVDFVISNMNTMIVETVQAFSVPEINHTDSSTNTVTSTLTGTNTSTKFPTATFFILSKTPTRPSRFSTPTPKPPPTRTFTPLPIPTNTFTPIPTNTPIPDTFTPIPDTDTPVPDTDTPVPDTDTPVPPDTDTPVPPDTDTPAAVVP